MNGVVKIKGDLGARPRARGFLMAVETGLARDLKCRSAMLSLLVFVGIVCQSNVTLALGMGAASAESHIGETLSIHVPLFNVQDPDSLEVELRVGAKHLSNELLAELERANSQLGIRIRSTQAINEPYLSFSLDLIDAGNSLSKEFMVLLDLSAAEQARSKGALSSAGPATLSNSTSLPTAKNSKASIMGPYDWAVAGQIPDKFGAVLDGQSLWRVARRINKAMDVSLDQMMWALYSQNPQAFTSNSISSLQAGSYLQIPSQATVAAVSTQEAKSRLSDVERRQQPSSAIAQVPAHTVSDAVTVQHDRADISGAVAQATPPFQLTGLDQSAQANAQGSLSSAKSQEIIGSLAQTVGNLTQELIRKDKHISFLEEKVAALEAYAGLDAGTALPGLSDIDEAADADPTANETQAREIAAQTPLPAAKEVANQNSTSPLKIILLGLLILSLVGLFFRERVVQLMQSLNLFGRNDSVEFEPTVYSDPELRESMEVKPDKDYSILSAVEHTMNDKEAIEGISYLSLEEGGTYKETAVEPSDEITLVPDQELTFTERFNRLIEEKDFDFARELLDFARYNEIDDQRYHCERLRLFQAMHDEDGFYEYYYEIETKIPQFDQAMQTKISQLVVQLAQH